MRPISLFSKKRLDISLATPVGRTDPLWLVYFDTARAWPSFRPVFLLRNLLDGTAGDHEASVLSWPPPLLDLLAGWPTEGSGLFGAGGCIINVFLGLNFF